MLGSTSVSSRKARAPDSLAAAIREVLTFADADLRARCRDYALARFDWDRVTPAWEEALEEAASSL